MFLLKQKILANEADLVEELLFAAGAQSVTSSRGADGFYILDALFMSEEEARAFCKTSGRSGEVSPVAPGWQDRWLDYVNSVTVTPYLTVSSSGISVAPDSVKYHLLLDAKGTFGLGSHPTTALCAEALEYLHTHDHLKGRTILDVGTGSGLLALYSELLGAGDIVGFDVDRVSVDRAIENGQRNNLPKSRFLVSSIENFVFHDASQFVIANIPVELHEAYHEQISSFTANDGHLAVSGFTARWRDLVESFYGDGFCLIAEFWKDEWCALLLKKA